MEPEIINLKDKRMEQTVIAVSALVATAVQMHGMLRERIDSSERVLMKAQLELEELFIALDTRPDRFPNPPSEG